MRLVLAPMLLLAGCASGSVLVEKLNPGVEELKTFDWVAPPGEDLPGALGEFARGQLRVIIANGLQVKGYTQTASTAAPDFRIAFFVLDDGQASSAWRSTRSRAFGGGFGRTTRSSNVLYVSGVGPLVVEIIDVVTRQTIWRGTSRNRVHPDVPDNLLYTASEIVERVPVKLLHPETEYQ